MNSKNRQQNIQVILSEQTNKQATDASFQKAKKILEQSGQIPLYLSNSSFKFDQLEQDTDCVENYQNQRNLENQKQNKISHTSKTEKFNQIFEDIHQQQSQNKELKLDIQVEQRQKRQQQASYQSSQSPSQTENQNDHVLCKNRQFFTQSKQEYKIGNQIDIQDQIGVVSNKQERVNSTKKSYDNLFGILNPPAQYKTEENVISLRQHQKNIEKLHSLNSINIQEKNITNKTENRQQTFASSENENENENDSNEKEDDFNQDFYMKHIIQINSNEEQSTYLHNNICDITTITNSVQVNNEEFKISNNTSHQKMRAPIESSDNSFEIDMNKKQKIQLKNVLSKQIEKEKNLDLLQKNKNIDPKSNLSKIIQDKEQELIDLRERKRMIEEQNSKNQSYISYEEHSKQIKELQQEVVEKENIIKELQEQIKNFQLKNNSNESKEKGNSENLLQELKERDQIIFNLQKELKEKLCDQESYKDKIKFYHEQQVKQQTNDILICQLNSTIKQQQYQIDKFDIIQKQKDDTIVQLESQFAQIKQQFRVTQEDLSKFRNENQDLKLKLKDLERENELSLKQLSELRANCDQLSTENNKVKEQYIKKMQQMSSSQEQKFFNELEHKIGQAFTYQFTDKNYTLGNEQTQNQLKKINQDINQNNELTQEYLTNETQTNTKFIEKNLTELRRNSLNKQIENFQIPEQNQIEQKLNKSQLNNSALNLSSEQFDQSQISPQNQQVVLDNRLKERTSSQESGIQRFLNSSQINLFSFKNTLNPNDYNGLSIASEVQQNPRNYRSNSSYDGFARASSSQANYNTLNYNQQYQQPQQQQPSNCFLQSQVSYQPCISQQQAQQIINQPKRFNNNNNYNENNLNSSVNYNHQSELENQQVLQERNILNQFNYQAQDKFGRKNSDTSYFNKNQKIMQKQYIPSTLYSQKLNSNKENSYQLLNQTYDYLTNVRSSSPLNTSVNNIKNTINQQNYYSTNEKPIQNNIGKLRYAIPSTINHNNHQLPLTSFCKQFK
ncbi:hypothetical protein TTHERM_00702250 (macronuclear) [Tetrahymena thermophila SB210]|uniref:Uncharacterized protein n=1 Tax=Tetrahymena thermophila (strain SB210) TaxID=312017 RepID=Q22LM3_TETTS|nr:hypothetical protein TTHERM_00702250 [Tetrahymena thermophila SB210]EAR86243.2 hypothetical protein TTHERM_00702250 [Tetrahymena thermophila SB210]|eukprot:XP_976838.2 hypothetical protein TTHERM_00702250 [Tetrahymena thermophila SB210]